MIATRNGIDPSDLPALDLRRPDSERIALLEAEVRHLGAEVGELRKSLRLVERIVIALAVAQGLQPLLSSLM